MLFVLLAAALATLPAPFAAPVTERPSTLRARVSDPATIQAAVKQAIASTPDVAREHENAALSVAAYPGFARAVDEARVPDCLHPDALKHQPAKIGPMNIGGIYALPFLAAAILRGKCK
jgi:hypothetical protein